MFPAEFALVLQAKHSNSLAQSQQDGTQMVLKAIQVSMVLTHAADVFWV